jgi:hypothetical protein
MECYDVRRELTTANSSPWLRAQSDPEVTVSFENLKNDHLMEMSGLLNLFMGVEVECT